MKRRFFLTIICVLSITAAACVPRQTVPVSEIEPAAMLEAVAHRRATFNNGLSGVLEINVKQAGKRFGGKAYITAFPDGPFRLEIPGPMGHTLLAMVNDGQEITAYYPERGEVYLSLTDGLSINPHLPFPLPIKTNMLAAFLMGTMPAGSEISEMNGYLLRSGERQFRAELNTNGLEFTYLFSRGQTPSINSVEAHGKGLDLKVTTRKEPPYLPGSFSMAFQDTTLTGNWEKAVVFEGDRSILSLNTPQSALVTDLRGRH